MSPSPVVLVFSDMDGTLLDHFDYSFSAAEPALARLRRAAIPLILNTSKTFAELLSWRQRLHTTAPFIVENGAAVYVPQTADGNPAVKQFGAQHDGVRLDQQRGFDIVELVPKRAEVLRLIHELRRREGYQFSGFADFDAQTLCEMTGLSQNDADCALERGYSEPICWKDSDTRWQQFEQQLADAGLQVLHGGRFRHIMGAADKGAAMNIVAQLISGGRETVCIALGDSGNDLAMLAQADYAVVVRSPVQPPLVVPNPRGRVSVTDAEGPAGWNASLMTILDELGQ